MTTLDANGATRCITCATPAWLRIMTSDIDIFYGVASGQQRSALSRLDPEAIMISHATNRNDPIEGEYELFIDCGGYHHMVNGSGEYDDSDGEYIDYLLDTNPEYWALRDYPCEPDLLADLGRSVRHQQQKSIDNHVRLYDMAQKTGIADTAVAVLQGWTADDYLRHLDALRDCGLLTSRVAIGSVCRRNADIEIASIVRTVRDALPPRCELHAFGVKGSVLQYREVVAALDSVDSAAYDYVQSRQPSERSDGESFTWRDCARAYLNWRHDLESKLGTQSLDDPASTQATFDSDASFSTPQPTRTTPSDVSRVCVCGTTIPPYGSHTDFDPKCRHCESVALNYSDRELTPSNT